MVAAGITLDGTKVLPGLAEGATENATVVTDLLVGLRERGLDATRPILVVIDGAKPLRRAVNDVFDHPVIQRCQLHKLRNVTDRLPDTLASTVAKRMRVAYHILDPLVAEAELERLPQPGACPPRRGGKPARRAGRDPDDHPGCATHPRSELAQHEHHRADDRDLPRSRRQRQALAGRPDGAAPIAAGMGEARGQFRRVNGHLHLPTLRPPSTPPSPLSHRPRRMPPDHRWAATEVPRHSGHPRQNGR